MVTPAGVRQDMQGRGEKPVVSLVVPAFNEEESVSDLFRRIDETLRPLTGMSWEMIVVDDGSRDATWARICELAVSQPRVKGIRLSRNFGHQYALMAGLEHSTGDAVITLDCDLQHPVELLPEMLARWRTGHQVVKTLRRESDDTGWFKRITSHTYYRLFSWLSGVDLQPGMADFRLLDRRALNELLRFREEGLFLRGLTEWIGFSSCVVPYDAAPRLHGKSRYSLRKMISLAWHGVSSFSIMPLRIGILTGLVGSLFSVFGVFYAFYGKFVDGRTVPGWASTLLVISLLFSLLFVYLGILGEYIGRIVVEVRQRPRFIICESTGFRPPGSEADG